MLDTEVLQHLPDEYKERLIKWEKVFNSEGWELVVGWAEASAEEAKDRVFLAPNWDESIAWKAKWFTFTELTKLEETTYQEFENIARQAMEDKDILLAEEFE